MTHTFQTEICVPCDVTYDDETEEIVGIDAPKPSLETLTIHERRSFEALARKSLAFRMAKRKADKERESAQEF